MSGIQLNEDMLEDFYNLKTLNPQTSWNDDSNYVYKLSKWNNVVPDSENSYDVLRDLMAEQKKLSEERSSGKSGSNAQNNLLDPLNNEHITELLRQLNIDSDDEKATYLINNKKFISNKFLRDVHNKVSFEVLNASLINLDSIIEEQSTDLKILVQNNFTSYVKIKNRLDKIYNQFAKNVNDNNLNGDSSNLDIEELGQKVDESVRATNLKLKPIMDTSVKLTNYRMTKQFIEDNRQFFDLPRLLKKHLEKKDFPNFIINYNKGLEIVETFRSQTNGSSSQVASPDDSAIDISLPSTNVPKIIDIIWKQVENTLDNYRKDTVDTLLTHSSPIKIESQDIFLPLMSKLIDLKEVENPILKWINFYFDDFESQLNTTSDHLLQRIIDAQKKINKIGIDENDDMDGVNITYYLSINQLFKPIVYEDLNFEQKDGSNSNIYDSYVNSSTDSIAADNGRGDISSALASYHGLTDTPLVVEMWLSTWRYITEFNNISNVFIQFWQHIENFLDGTYQNNIINEKKKDNILIGDVSALDNIKRILALSKEEKNDIRIKGDNFVRLIYKKLTFFFQASQASLSNFTPGQISKADSMTSLKQEKETGSPLDYGFVPPRANGLGCVRYIPLIFEPFLRFVTQLAQLGISTSTVDMARNLVSLVIDRSIGAISSTKLRDISNFYKLENWEVYASVPEGTDDLNSSATLECGVTQFPEIVLLVQQYSIKVIRGLLFSFEKLPIINGISITNYPSKQILTGIEVQQIVSMEAVLEAILKNAAKDKDNPRNPHTILTLTNLQYIREFTFPTVLRCFDESFDWELRSKPLEIFNLLGKMESSIFGNYLSDLKITLRNVLEERFHQINWPMYSSNSFRVNDYIIEALMLLINVHSECYRIGPQLINKIIKETQVFISRYLFESFKPFVGNLSSDGLLQITVDTMFFEKVLGPYLEQDTQVTLNACLQNVFQNNMDRLERCVNETSPIVDSNLERTSIQFAAFK